MNELTPSQDQRKETLEAIKEYVLSLLNKKKIRESHTQKTKEAIENTLNQTELQGGEQKTEKSISDQQKQTVEGNKKTPKQESGGLEIPPDEQDEYIPQDSEFGEALGESSRFAEIYPAFTGYYTQGKKSYFNPQTNLRSKKKQLRIFNHTLVGNGQKYTYAGFVKPGLIAIPLPEGALPETVSLSYTGSQAPHFQIDQNNCAYISSIQKQAVSFQFACEQVKNNTPPVPEDTENIIFSTLTSHTQTLLNGLLGKPSIDQARALSYYIKSTKKYNTNRQGTLRNIANSNNYISNLDESPILECYSANSLLVGLCRKLGIPARLVVGHMVQGVAKDGKSHLSNNNGHAWTEIRDGLQWLRLDATPTIKENGEESNQNGDNQEQSSQTAQSNMNDGVDSQDGGGETQESKPQEGDEPSGGEGEGENNQGDIKESQEGGREESDKESTNNDPQNKQQGEMSGPREQKPQPSKSSVQMLDEFIKKAKEDNLTTQGEQLTKTLEQLESANSKENIRKILDEAGLSDFAKEEIDKIGNQGILAEERKELEKIDDEKELEKKLQQSLLDPEFKRKLQEYADVIKKRIEEQKQKMKSEMERMGFTDQELGLYKQYKVLEKEVMPEVRRQIEELKKILPPQYIVQKDEDNYYRSGSKLDRNKLTDRKINGNNKIFQRAKVEVDTQAINMFETIIIDRSGSMGIRSDPKSPFSQSVKAAITRAKVLEHFKVEMSIVIFDDSIDEVMNFGEVFSERSTKIPSKLMRAYTERSGGNSQEPITLVYGKMKERMRQLGGKSFGNISFIGDGDLYQSNQVPVLKAMIDDLKKQGMGVTAYYINKDERKMPLIEYYFGKPEDGHAIYAKDIQDLGTKVISNHKTKLDLLIRKYLKTQY